MAKKKKNKKSKISIPKIIGLILWIVSILLLIELIAIDIIPTKYIMVSIGSLVLMNLIVDIGIFKKRRKKGIRGFMTGLAVILILAFSAVLAYLIMTMGFLNSIKASEFKIENYSVVVLKNSKYKKVSDIEGLSVGYYDKTNGSNKAIKKLSKKVDVTFDAYNDSHKLSNKLLDEKKDLEVILVEDSILTMIKEENQEFEKNTKVIYTFKVLIKVKNNKIDVDVTSKPFNVYISGIDTFGEITSVSRSDVNMVVTVNPKTKQILLTSIPRDYYVKLHTYKEYDKLTHAGMYGTEESIKTIEDLLDIKINYYIKVNFTSVIDIVNALGGLKVYSEYDFISEDKFHYSKGYNEVNGEQALSFARERHAFADGDRQRVKDQQAVFQALFKKICSKTILTKYSSILNSMEGKFDTNMSSGKIKSLVKMQLNDMATWTITSVSLDGYNSRNSTYSAGSQLLYVMNPDEGSVEDASKLIKEVISGKKLKGSYELNSSGTSSVTKIAEDSKEKETEESIDADISCQNGYTLSSDKTVCTKVETEKPNTSCSNGEEDEDGYCYAVVATLECNPDKIDDLPCDCTEGTLKDGKCVKKVSSTPTCSDGYKLNGNNCTKTSTVTPSYSCPSGYRLEGKLCTK